VFLVSLAAKTALTAAVSLSGYGYVTVAPGDTLSAIAAANGTTWQAVYAANQAVIGANPNVIYAGEHLVIPGGGAASPAPAPGGTPAASAPAAPTAAQQPAGGTAAGGTAAGSGGTSGSGNIPPSFFSCVHLRESSNGQASNNQFGILPSTWSAYGFPGSPDTASYSQQVAAFERIYASVGASAWAPYDGC
jgi:LysM repeat protein